MAYKLIDSKPSTNPGHARYQFYVRYLGKKYENIVSCPKSAVQTLHREWEQRIISGSIGKQYKLFQIFDMYMSHITDLIPESSIRHTRRSIELFKECFSNMKIREFKRYHVEQFVKWRRNYRLRKGIGPEIADRTINREIAELSKVISWSIKRDYYVGNNPCFSSKLRVDSRRNIHLSSEQIEELLSKAKPRGLIYTAVLIAILSGMRMKEIYTLSWSDVDFDQSRIHIRGKNTKGKKGRIVAMPQYLRNHLTELRQANPFTITIFHKWKTAETLRSQWVRLRKILTFKEINGETLHFHDLRHIFAQSLVDAGVNVYDVSAFLGHSEIGITQRFYVQSKGLNALEKVEKISEIIPIFKTKAIS